MPTITLTRQPLYDRAWPAHIETLGKVLGLSGRGLAKLCERYDSPRAAAWGVAKKGRWTSGPANALCRWRRRE